MQIYIIVNNKSFESSSHLIHPIYVISIALFLLSTEVNSNIAIRFIPNGLLYCYIHFENMFYNRVNHVYSKLSIKRLATHQSI